MIDKNLPRLNLRLLLVTCGGQGLGLKLEPRKLPLELLLFDHREKTPTANGTHAPIWNRI
jgi:uncharacterized protein (TIGR03435 family)